MHRKKHYATKANNYLLLHLHGYMGNAHFFCLLLFRLHSNALSLSERPHAAEKVLLDEDDNDDDGSSM